MNRVAVNTDMLRWARERAACEPQTIARRFPKLAEWEEGVALPTLRQLEDFARAMHVPFGYLLLPAPPEESLPIQDFRTFADRDVSRPSPNLLDMIYTCQERQDWYREFAQVTRRPELAFVGSATTNTSPEQAAKAITSTLGFDLEARRNCHTWTEALQLFVQKADCAGVLVMVSGVVLSNNRRRLNPEEFRGFALADRLAPLVFINGADTKAAQIFTLAHELAHLWLGASAISDACPVQVDDWRPEEIWSNQVAAELLAPLDVVRSELRDGEALEETLSRLAKYFKVSTLVILRRLLDAGRLDRAAFDRAYQRELQRLHEIDRGSTGGGDFYRTTLSRVGRRFTSALVESTLEGQTLYRDAFRMLGITKTKTFNELGRIVRILP